MPRKMRRAKLKAMPAAVAKALSVDNAAHSTAATSPYNLKPLPSAARIRAGNYAKGHIRVAGIEIAIENPAGSKRRPEWPEMKSHYGYIKRTEGADGDAVDCFVHTGTPRDYSGPIWVINQNVSGKFDEHKVMIGWYTEAAARKGYLDNYTPDWNGLASIKRYSVQEFKQWLKSGNTTVAAKLQQGGALLKAVDPYKELTDRFLRLLAEEEAKLKKDEVGHEFHGNQWTGGIGGGKPAGAKPTSSSEKGVKGKVHDLLSSGHKFTFQELHEACGKPPEKALKNALSELKNPKWAGPKGALTIVKIGDNYLVEPGFKAPAGDKAEPAAAAKPAAAEEVPAGTKTEGGIKYASNFGSKTVQPWNQYKGAPATKAQADEIYKGQKELNEFNFKNNISLANGDQQKIADALKEFKEGRADALAQWKANTTGEAQVVQSQNIYEADKLLGKNVAEGMPMDKAMMQWKNDTAAEKMGTLGKKPEVEAAKPAAKEEPVPTTKGEALPPLTEANQISAKDFSGDGKSDFETLFTATGQAFKKQSDDAVTNKKTVESQLKAQLNGNAAFQKLRNGLKAQGNKTSAERALVAKWAGTSNDHDNVAIAMQLAARDEFNLDKDSVNFNRASQQLNSLGESGIYAAAGKEYGVSGPEFRAGAMAFQRAQYDVTQKFLADAGLKEVALVRGMKEMYGSGVEEVGLNMQPASSFSHNYGTAHSFSGGHSVFAVKVPATQVLGSYRTGYGCSNEFEVVLLGGKNFRAVRIGYKDASGIKEMAGSVKSYFNGKGVS